MEIKSTFANRLKELRTEKGLSQEDFGKEIGVSRGSISYYEKEERVPDIVVLAAVSKHFNVSTDYLLGISEHKSINAQKAVAAEKLEPCPFCGDEAKYILKNAFGGSFVAGFEFVIQCSKCKVEYPVPFKIALTMSDDGQIKELVGTEGVINHAVEAWNRRADNG